VLRRTFGSKKEEAAGGWRKLCNELCNFNASPNIIRVIKLRRMTWIGHVAHMKMRHVYKIFVGKPAEKRPLERPWYRWEDNIRKDLRNRLGRCGRESSGSQQEPVDMVMNPWVP